MHDASDGEQEARTVEKSTGLARASDDGCSLLLRPPQIDDRNLQWKIAK